ncbi:MAG TPA: ankyrin repeat domain-containing protein, partial [Coxiellaceae bacterium]|nr:ankyrin repeat domain-containing protein [Coxiellaceae bacterium]
SLLIRERLGVPVIGLWSFSEGGKFVKGIIDRGDEDAFEVVLNNGRWPSLFFTDDNLTLVSYIAKKGCYKMLESLLAVYPSQVNSGLGLPRCNSSPLVEAARAGHVDIVELLINHGADVDYINEYHETAELVATDERILHSLTEAKKAITRSFGK